MALRPDLYRRILEREINQKPIISIYQTGSTVRENTSPGHDIDYLLILDNDSHFGRDYASRYEDMSPPPDLVYFTSRDLRSPSSITEAKFDKIAYLMREKKRPRELVFGEDVFLKLLNEEELEEEAGKRKIGPDTMNNIKEAIRWE